MVFADRPQSPGAAAGIFQLAPLSFKVKETSPRVQVCLKVDHHGSAVGGPEYGVRDWPYW